MSIYSCTFHFLIVCSLRCFLFLLRFKSVSDIFQLNCLPLVRRTPFCRGCGLPLAEIFYSISFCCFLFFIVIFLFLESPIANMKAIPCNPSNQPSDTILFASFCRLRYFTSTLPPISGKSFTTYNIGRHPRVNYTELSDTVSCVPYNSSVCFQVTLIITLNDL